MCLSFAPRCEHIGRWHDERRNQQFICCSNSLKLQLHRRGTQIEAFHSENLSNASCILMMITTHSFIEQRRQREKKKRKEENHTPASMDFFSACTKAHFPVKMIVFKQFA